MRLVWAVRDGDIAEMTAAIAAARDAANHPYWTTALVLVLAGMVADGVKASELLAWNS
ncbi:MAG: hypothetical protein JO296_21280 [Pseudonocardiales bacterium]|nr:hypothetical protein [Pseudonocardiales bacterium]